MSGKWEDTNVIYNLIIFVKMYLSVSGKGLEPLDAFKAVRCMWDIRKKVYELDWSKTKSEYDSRLRYIIACLRLFRGTEFGWELKMVNGKYRLI